MTAAVDVVCDDCSVPLAEHACDMCDSTPATGGDRRYCKACGFVLCDDCWGAGAADTCQGCSLGSCRRCGCTDLHGGDGGCWWVDDRLCSACAQPDELPRSVVDVPVGGGVL